MQVRFRSSFIYSSIVYSSDVTGCRLGLYVLVGKLHSWSLSWSKVACLDMISNTCVKDKHYKRRLGAAKKVRSFNRKLNIGIDVAILGCNVSSDSDVFRELLKSERQIKSRIVSCCGDSVTDTTS